MRRLLFGLIALMIVGCADGHQLNRIHWTTSPLSRQVSAYIALPADGSYGQTVYQGSGTQTALAIAAAVVPYLREVSIAETYENLDEARQSANNGNYHYVLYPRILHWEDRATEWSGRPDVVAISISVIQADSGAVLDDSMINGRSGIATLGGDHPQDLLPPALGEYAAALFR